MRDSTLLGLADAMLFRTLFKPVTTVAAYLGLDIPDILPTRDDDGGYVAAPFVPRKAKGPVYLDRAFASVAGAGFEPTTWVPGVSAGHWRRRSLIERVLPGAVIAVSESPKSATSAHHMGIDSFAHENRFSCWHISILSKQGFVFVGIANQKSCDHCPKSPY